MGQKVNPIANRLGIIRGWDSNWYGGKDFSDKLVEDAKIRKYLNVRLAKASISKIIIERTLKLVTVTISTARPGIIIGKGGQEVDKLKEELKKLTGKEIQINIFEVKRPEVDAVIVGADRIAANGDAANKIGTYGVAVLARHHGIPFYVAAPISTIDPAIADGSGIPIEERDASEVLPVAIEGVDVWNPAFDVTPAGLITRIVTERGAFEPDKLVY